MKRFKIILILLIVFSMLLISCDDDNDNEQGLNYEDGHNWVSMPSAIEKEVDVFYVYPTVSHNDIGAMDVTNEEERALAQGIFATQASVYEEAANVFAPFYRQMSTGVQLPDDPEALATDIAEFKQGAADIEEAFEYYLTNLNDNCPFIIAGHSQGTMALIELIKNRFGYDDVLRSRLIAAYLIGYTVTDSDLELSGLTAAQQSDDTGVVVTYNTQSVTSTGGPMLMPGANCINPLNWKTDSTFADSTENLGAVFYNDASGEFESEEIHYCCAQIDSITGALTTSLTPEQDSALEIGPYPPGVYHRFDYAFWFRNLQENVQVRINAFQNK